MMEEKAELSSEVHNRRLTPQGMPGSSCPLAPEAVCQREGASCGTFQGEHRPGKLSLKVTDGF